MIEELLSEIPVTTPMVTQNQVRIILTELEKTNDLSGDVVELGCNKGTTTIFLQAYIQRMNLNKRLHVYDSFEGLPERLDVDWTEPNQYKFHTGGCKSNFVDFSNNVKQYVSLPQVNIGWFNECSYPDEISFAFFDGDFYSSIMDSFNKVYHKVVKGGIICIHDYQWYPLPGVEKAVNDFLKDKKEFGKVVFNDYIGILIKE